MSTIVFMPNCLHYDRITFFIGTKNVISMSLGIGHSKIHAMKLSSVYAHIGIAVGSWVDTDKI